MDDGGIDRNARAQKIGGDFGRVGEGAVESMGIFCVGCGQVRERILGITLRGGFPRRSGGEEVAAGHLKSPFARSSPVQYTHRLLRLSAVRASFPHTTHLSRGVRPNNST